MANTLPKITIDEAIASLQNIVDYWSTRPTEQAAAQMAIDALREKQNKVTNPPLTKAQVSAMNERHIYIQTIHNGKPTGTVVCQLWNAKHPVFKLQWYGVTWRAFTSMPPLTETF